MTVETVSDGTTGMYTTPWVSSGVLSTYRGIPIIVSEDVVPADPDWVAIDQFRMKGEDEICDDCDELTTGRIMISYMGKEIGWCLDCYNFHRQEKEDGLNPRIE